MGILTTQGTPRFPAIPNRRIHAALNQRGCASPTTKVAGRSLGGKVASQARAIGKSHLNLGKYMDSQAPDSLHPLLGMVNSRSHQGLTALSVEFVAKPEEAQRAEHSIPVAMQRSLSELTGYAGCLVMISDQEARLITVITFWSGPQGAQLSRQNAKWVNALLKPFMDRCLRSQTFLARLPFTKETDSAARQEISGHSAKTVELENELLTVA